MESDPCDGLSHQEEEGDVNAQQPAEIPRRRIDHVAVAEQDHGSRGEQLKFSGCIRVHAGSHDRVSARFQEGRQKQEQKRLCETHGREYTDQMEIEDASDGG